MGGFVNYIKGAFIEFKDKVVWPKATDLISSMVVVAISTLILSIFCFGVDHLFIKALNSVYSILIGLKS